MPDTVTSACRFMWSVHRPMKIGTGNELPDACSHPDSAIECVKRKDVGALLRLSHGRALASPRLRISNSIAHAEIYCRVCPLEAGHNTLKVDVPVAFLLRLNLRDSTVEDNVRKRPFSTKFRPAHPYGLPKSATKIQKISEPPSDSEKKLYRILRFNVSGFIRVSQMSTMCTMFEDG